MHLTERLKYVSIINYLSAALSFHKLHDVSHVDPSSLQIIHRTIGDSPKRSQPIGVTELVSIYQSLDMHKPEDVAYWVAFLLGFRGLLGNPIS